MKLRPVLAEALGYGSASPWQRRIDLIRRLPGNLPADETDALLTALMTNRPPDVAVPTYASYVHEIASILQSHAEIRARFANVLAALARDTSRDATIRDYAIQHLRLTWTRAADQPALQTSIANAFREFTHLDTGISTSVLLSLHMLGASAPAPRDNGQLNGASSARPAFNVPDADLATLLPPIFASKSSQQNMPARLTAIRIIGQRRLKSFRQPLLIAVGESNEHARIRMAAVYALGEIGDPADLKTFAKLEPSDDLVANAIRLVLRADASR